MLLKRYFILSLLLCASLMQACSSGGKEPNESSGVGADTIGGTNTDVDRNNDKSVEPAGATSPEDLGRRVFDALKINDFTALKGTIPTKELVSSAQTRATQDTAQPPLLKNGAQVLQGQLQSNFQKIEQAAQQAGVDWTKTSMGNVNVLGNKAYGDMNVGTIEIPISYNNKSYTISAEGTSFNGKWYLSGDMQWMGATNGKVH